MTQQYVFKGALAAAVMSLAACGGGGDSSPAAPNAAPTAAASLSGEAVANTITTLDSSQSKDSDGAIAKKAWVYGDGQTGTTDTHIYTAPGTYSATLTVTDDKGASSNKSVLLTVTKCSKAGTSAAAASSLPTVCMQTTKGEIVLELDDKAAPISVANFLSYVDENFYPGTVFHRVEPSMVAQAGGFDLSLNQKVPTHAAITLESANGLKNLKYTIGMARSGLPNSATSQFYFNLANNAGFDYNAAIATPNGYAVFGKVISGTSTIDAIGSAKTMVASGFNNLPETPIVIRSVLRMP
jgi:cyclophilin family peptidyl-prolyl cis-trans isomerase